jgi:hypothetical protein
MVGAWSRFLLKLLGQLFMATGGIQTGGIQWVPCQR